MAEIEYTLTDLIKFSSDQKPIEFSDAFKSVIADKIGQAIDNKKINIAQSMFNGSEDELQDQEDLEDQEEEDQDAKDS